MQKENSSALQNTEQEKEEEIQKIQKEIELLEKSELNEEQTERLLFLLEQLSELKNIPKFDVKKGWEEFERDYLPVAEEFREKEKERKRKKIALLKNMMNLSFVLIFAFVFSGVVTGRNGFVNYFSRNTQETEVISDKEIKEIQKEIKREYETLETECGVKFAKLNLSSNNYNLQDYILANRYMSIVYFDVNMKENIIFWIYKNKHVSGKINMENDKVIEAYSYEGITYNITENMERYYISWEKEGVYYILQNCSSLEECKNIIGNITY